MKETEKFTFFIGFRKQDGNIKYKNEIMFRDMEFEDTKKATKFLNAMKEIFNYIKKGHIYD